MTIPYIVRGIPSPMVESLWKYAEPFVLRALEHSSGETDPAHMKHHCQQRNAQLWLISHGAKVVGAATTEIVNYDCKKHLRIITVGGNDFAAWMEAFDNEMCQWAKSLDCDAVEAAVRKGFINKLSGIGYQHRYSVVVKKLDIMPGAIKNEVEDNGQEVQRE